ncbi:MAG: hypothetical protein AAF557_27235 [Pseudomonadota bacterium]
MFDGSIAKDAQKVSTMICKKWTRRQRELRLLAALATCWPTLATGQINNIEHVQKDQALLTLQVATWVPQDGHDPGAVESYYDSAGKVVRLSSAETIPFRLRFPSLRPNLNEDEYQEGLTLFPSVRDCLLTSERDNTQPDLTRFDWSKMPNHSAAQVCLIWIFTSYDKAADVLWWMAKQRMTVQRFYGRHLYDGTEARILQDKTILKLNYSRKFGVGLSAGFGELPYGGPKEPWPLSAFENKGYGITVRFSKSFGIFSVGVHAHGMK